MDKGAGFTFIRNFKSYYTEHICQHLRGEFQNLVTYERFVILMPSALEPWNAYLKSFMGVVAVFRLLTQLRWRSVKTIGSITTGV
jgi:hypothetical protein